MPRRAPDADTTPRSVPRVGEVLQLAGVTHQPFNPAAMDARDAHQGPWATTGCSHSLACVFVASSHPTAGKGRVSRAGKGGEPTSCEAADQPSWSGPRIYTPQVVCQFWPGFQVLFQFIVSCFEGHSLCKSTNIPSLRVISIETSLQHIASNTTRYLSILDSLLTGSPSSHR